VSISVGESTVSPGDLVRSAQEVEDDCDAMRGVLQRLATDLSCSRAEVVATPDGVGTVIVAAGNGPGITMAPRVTESGLAIGFDDGSEQAGLPVRLGAQLLGALVCRWPVDRRPPARAQTVLELAAAVLAPRLESLLCRSRSEALASTAVPELVGTSQPIADVRRAIARAARAPFAVLIEGESGTGKELVARAIHQLGPRRARRFCDVNCAALPDDLFESELFGHARGAFTGAVAERPGLFEEASGGTLFLDEVAELSARAQAKLQRAVQQQEIRRVGESFSRSVDVRVVAAANRDKQREAAAGNIPQDLLYRLNVIRIRMPPLRERLSDIPQLARHFWDTAAARVGSTAALTPAAIADLARYQWPGNVRELQNVISALAVAAPSRGRVSAALLPPIIGASTTVTALRLADARLQFDRRFIEAALARAAGSRTRAAAALGVSRQGLLKLMARLQIGEDSSSG
jgi:two-component system response regulator AtoC